MDPLHIVLIVLAIAGIWAIVELALTIRKTRSTVDDLAKQVGDITTSANETIGQVQPIVAKADSMMTDLEPAIKKVDPLMDKATTAVDVVTVDLASVNDILVDVSSVTDTASNVTSTVSKAANSAVSGVAGVVGKFTNGKKSHDGGRRLHGKSDQGEGAEALIEESAGVAEADADAAFDFEADSAEAPTTYFTYGDNTDAEAE